MQKGEHYICQCCGADLEVLVPCTCEQKQDMVCTCGSRMEAKAPAKTKA